MSICQFVTGGFVPYDSPVYIERDADAQARLHLERMEYIKLTEPRQQGKTSLIHRLIHTLGSRYVCSYINATRLDKTSEVAWYKSLYDLLLPQLKSILFDVVPSAPVNGWAWGNFLTEMAAKAADSQYNLVIVFDELGDILVDWRTGFFSNMRAIFDERLAKPWLKHLTFIFAGTYNPRILMNDPNTSPFNVAQEVSLPDFTLPQIYQLVSYLALPDTDKSFIAQGMHYWTDGQPYLTQYFCRRIAEGHIPPTLAGIDRAASALYREDAVHLPRILEQLTEDKNLYLRSYTEKVLNGYCPMFHPTTDNRYHNPLALIGIIKADGQLKCKIRNQIYEYALRNALLNSSLEEENNMSDFADGYALIIGIANYPNVHRLPETVLKDARDTQTLLRSPTQCGYRDTNVRLLLDDQANAEGIRTGMRWLSELAGPRTTALVFFSGHGGRLEDGSQTNHYLIPYDCDPANLKESAISGEELTGMLRNIRSQRLLVCFDSCYAGGTGETKGLIPEFKSGLEESYFAQLAQGTGRVIMASSRSDEESLVLRNMNNSLFTHYLLEALRGHAPTHDDGLIRVFDVFHYIAENVPKRGPQHPIFKATDVENNFPIALCLGGKQRESSRSSLVSPRSQPSTVNKRDLRGILAKKFTFEELQILCADIEQDLVDDGIELPVNLDLVGGSIQEVRAINLIRYLDNAGYLAYLVRAVRRMRPGML